MSELDYTKAIGFVELPVFYKCHQHFLEDGITDPYEAVQAACKERGVLDRIQPGMTVAITAGSREYSSAAQILRAVVDAVRSRGAEPFVIPAMGSHGGATAEGQQAVLEHMGITQETVGAPIRSQMDTVCVGISENGLEVHVDKLAWEADLVIPVNRVKAHTDFHGTFESGVVKMMAIGLGKQHGASVCHKQGFEKMSENVEQFGRVIIGTGKVPFGVALVENEQHQLCKVVAIPSETILEEEPKLLLYAKSRMPRLQFEQADLLFVDQIGKDFSGTGMDANVIGRSPFLGKSKPYFERVVIFDLTEKSGGNGNGMALADISTQKFIRKVDFDATYINGITASFPDPGKMPVIVPTEYNAYCYGIRACTRHGDAPIKVIHIPNTMSIADIYISAGLAAEIQNSSMLWIDPQEYLPQFGANGDFLGYRMR